MPGQTPGSATGRTARRIYHLSIGRVTDSKVTEGYKRRRNPIVDFVVRLVREKPLGTVGAVIVLGFLIAGVFGQWIAPYPMAEIHLQDRLLAPCAKYPLGTGMLGQDMLSQIIYGARVSLIIGFSVVISQTLISLVIGLTSGYIGGTFDMVVQRLVDAYNVLPSFIIYLTLIGLLGSGYMQMILIMGIGGGIGGARGPRTLAFWVREAAYFETARAIGCTTRQVLVNHLLPNIMPMLIVSMTMGIGGVILSEAGLSYLGWGLPPEVPSWGGMISGSNRVHMEGAAWLVVFPGIALGLTIFGLNVFGDAVRDLLDPRLRGGLGSVGSYGHERADKALKKLEIRKRANAKKDRP